MERLYRYHGLQNPTVLVALLNFDPEWPGVNLSDLPERFLDRLDILQLAHDQKEINQHFQILYENSLNKIRELYHDANIYKKDQILTRLLRLDLLDEIQGLISSHLQLPNTVLSQFSAEGLNCFVANNFLSARDHFKRVIEEDPSDSIAAQGLRLTLPRAGGKMDSILEVRNKHGYGITGAGRTGVNASIGSDKTISLLMSGQYKSGLYSKRHAAHWQLLKRIYGDRFYNYEQIPTDGSIKNLFIIGDEGVGDEVRTAQFYSYLSKTFERITISCDPRLTNIFQYSFPNITFIPVERYRKGLTKNSSSSDPRISGLNQKLSQILTNECKDLMDQADGITFGQNLFFNRFIGNIPFNKQGGYLSQNIKRQSTAKLKIGILWRSHFVTMWRKFMYLKVEDFLPITKLENIEIWSMQHCIEEDELEFCHKNNIKIVEGIDFFNDFDGMSPILEGLDLMIGISSLPMELAAAAGTPVWMLGFSPENYFLRTAGGNKEADQLSTNSTIIAPQWIDFSAPTTDCISLVMQEACKKLSKLQTSSSQHLQKTAPIALQC
ncbi:hypothetical protein GL2_39560 [Microbulbifer sp. GL-2]|nr:hypothetical protein GL2_39560 [Microbulbifer sp. GL-2]